MSAESIAAGGPARCPHLIFHNVLGSETVAALLDYVAAREKDFEPAKVRSRAKPEGEVVHEVRDCVYLRDLGAFENEVRGLIHNHAATTVSQLRLNEPRVELREFEIACYRDGGHFSVHVDTQEKTQQIRVLSCVCYFASTPRRFSGGELRLYGFPDLSNPGGAWPFVDVVPETDTLVAFPSWLRHEVLPVRAGSHTWADSRFTINCWLHRAAAAHGPPLA